MKRKLLLLNFRLGESLRCGVALNTASRTRAHAYMFAALIHHGQRSVLQFGRGLHPSSVSLLLLCHDATQPFTVFLNKHGTLEQVRVLLGPLLPRRVYAALTQIR